MANLEKNSGNAPQIPDRRVHLRRVLTSLAYIELGGDNGGIAINLSEGGVGAQSALVLTQRYLPRIRLQLPPSGEWIEFPGKVAWIGESGKQAGIEFVDLPQSARVEIEEWVSAGQSTIKFPEEAVSADERGSKLLEMPRARELRQSVPRSGASDDATEKVLQALSALHNASVHNASVQPPEPEAETASPPPPSSADLDRSVDTSMFTFHAQAAGDPIEAGMDRQRRSRRLAALGALLILAFFVVGLRFGRGSWDALLGYVEHFGYTVGGPTTTKDVSSTDVASSPSISSAESKKQQPAVSPSSQAQSSAKPAASPSGNGKIALEVGPSHAPQSSILVGAPQGSSPVRLNLPEEAVSASALVAITARRSIVVLPMHGPQPYPRTESLHIGALLSRVEPRYPPEAIQKRVEGTVELRATVSRMGEIENVKLESGPTLLAGAALSAVRAWRYDPTLINEQPIETEDDIKITFRLP